MNKRWIIYIVALFTALTSLNAQVKKPVTATTMLTPPHSLYLSDYVSEGSQKCRVTLTFNDYNEPSWDVYLTLKIESSNLLLETKPEFIPTEPVVLYPGVPKIMSGGDLYDYFNYDNLNIHGISRSELEKNGRLPEGFYTFTFEVRDYQTGRVLSNPAIFTANFRLNDPPQIINPLQGEIIKPQDAQFISFQWQMQNIDPLKTNYTLHLFEVTDTSSSLEAAIQNNMATQLFESNPTNLNVLNYGMDKPLLEEGHTYTFYVQASNTDGKEMFKNQGKSESSWFHYGYPKNGNIELTHPLDDHAFTLREDKAFKWLPPDNLTSGQPYHYEFKIVEYKGDQDPETVIETKEPVYERTTPVTLDRNTWNEYPDIQFRNKYKYAWQVKAYTGNYEIASSEVYVVHGPPFMEAFYAGNHIVYVQKTTKNDIRSLSGEGTIKFSNDGDKHKVYFNDIRLERSGPGLFLREGKCVAKCKLDSIKLTPEISKNGDAFFYPDSVLLDRYNLKLKGHVEWDFPHPTTSPQKAIVKSKTKALLYDDFVLTGLPKIEPNTSFDLIDPNHFRIELKNDSYFRVYKNNHYELYFSGIIYSTKNVKGIYSDTVKFHFNDQQQLYYMEENNFEFLNHIKPVPYTQLDIMPTRFVVDLSEDKSPPRLADSLSWKGVYLSDYIIKYNQFIDDHGQFILDNDVVQDVDVNTNSHYKGWITDGGLQFMMDINLPDSTTGYFNTFPSHLNKIRLNVENSSVSDSYVKGTIQIPVFSETQKFAYTIPVNDFGFRPGYLDESLSGKSFTFNENGGEQKLEISVNRAVFQEKSYLDMNVDVYWNFLDVTFQNINHFRCWGDYRIGFQVPNGIFSLTNQLQTEMKGFDITIDYIGAGREGTLYAFGTSANIVMADDIAGPEGPPVINLYSIAENSILTGTYSTAPNQQYQNVTTTSGGNQTMDGDYSSIGQMDAQMAVLDTVLADMQALKDRRNEIEQQMTAYTDSITSTNTPPEQTQNDSMVAEITVNVNNPLPSADELEEMLRNLSKEDVIAIIETLKLLLPEDKQQKFNAMITHVQTSQEDEFIDTYKKIFRYITDAKGVIKEKIDEALAGVNNKFITVKEQTKADITGFINEKTGTVNTALTTQVSKIIDGICDIAIDEAKKVNGKVDFAALLTEVKIATKQSVNNELKRSINESVKTNLKDPIVHFIDSSVYKRVSEYMYNTVTALVIDNLGNLKKVDISVTPVINDLKNNVLTGIKDDFHDTFIGENGDAMLTRITNTGKDAVNNYNWGNVKNDILNRLLGATAEEYAENLVEGAATEALASVGGETGDIGGQLAQNVDLDLNNVGSKLKKGQIGQIVKIDPSYIVVKTKVADFEGYVRMTEDDPVWGDSWQAKLDAVLKVKPQFTASVQYINGSTADATGDFKFWFVEVEAGNLGIPMSPIPLTLDRAGGKIYHHMARQDDMETYLPDRNTRYGAGLMAGFYDTPGKGNIIVFDLALEMAFLTEGYILDLSGDAVIANTIKNGEVTKSVALADGYLGYNSIEKHFVGNFSATVENKPLICAGGDMNIDISKDGWSVLIGTEEQPIYLDLLCTGNPIFQSWFNIHNTGLEVGLIAGIHLRGETPWIGPSACKVRAWAQLDFEVGSIVAIVWKPKLGIEKAVIWLEIYAGIGADYKTALKNGSITFASVYLYGEAGLETIPKTHIYGKLKGEVTILCFDIGFKMSMDKTFN